MSEFLPFVERFGLPVGMLVVIAYAIWKAAKWASPVVTRVAEKHLQAVDALEKNSERTAEAIEVLGRAVEAQGENTGRMLARLGDGVASLGRALGKDDATGLRSLPEDLRVMREEAERRRGGR